MGKIYLVIIWSFWCFIVIELFFSYIPSVFIVPDKIKETLPLLFPQGWGFFTKNPKDDNLIDVYKFTKISTTLLSIPNASSANFFGVSRKSRYIGYETAMLLIKADSNFTWSRERGMPTSDILLKSKVILVKHRPEYRYFEKGKEYVIIQHKIIPWAWAKYNQEKNNEYAYIKIKLI